MKLTLFILQCVLFFLGALCFWLATARADKDKPTFIHFLQLVVGSVIMIIALILMKSVVFA